MLDALVVLGCGLLVCVVVGVCRVLGAVADHRSAQAQSVLKHAGLLDFGAQGDADGG